MNNAIQEATMDTAPEKEPAQDEGQQKLLDAAMAFMGGPRPPYLAGFEGAGEIAATGEAVTGLEPGARVVGVGYGAFAEYILCGSGGVLRLPEGLSPRHAALAEPLSVALHGITRSGVAPGDSVMVFGAGPIGAFTIKSG